MAMPPTGYGVPTQSAPAFSRQQFKAQAQPPAIIMAVLAGLQVALWLMVSFVGFLELVTGQQFGEVESTPAETFLAMIVCLLIASLNGVILYGAIQFARLRSSAWAMASSIAMMIPCFGPCCVLGIPLGIWGLVVSNKVPPDAWGG